MTVTLSKKTILLWQLRLLVVFVLLCALLARFCCGSLWFLLPISIVFTVGSALILCYLPAYLKSYKITADSNTICITKGVLIKTVCVIPCTRLVSVKCIQTPVMSFLKLKLVLLKVSRGWEFVPEINVCYANQLINVVFDDKKDN